MSRKKGCQEGVRGLGACSVVRRGRFAACANPAKRTPRCGRLPAADNEEFDRGSRMNWKLISLLAFMGAVGCLVWLAFQKALLGTGPVTIGIQIASMLLLLWARITFGWRSFHATANPTAGGLMTRGPYRFLRHPIYAAIICALWAGIAPHFSTNCSLVALLASALLVVRMFAEEQLLQEEYPEYAEYARHTSRMLPFLY